MLPTASAVVSDVIEIARNLRRGCTGRIPPGVSFLADPSARADLAPFDQVHSEYYLKFRVMDKPAFSRESPGCSGATRSASPPSSRRGRDRSRFPSSSSPTGRRRATCGGARGGGSSPRYPRPDENDPDRKQSLKEPRRNALGRDHPSLRAVLHLRSRGGRRHAAGREYSPHTGPALARRIAPRTELYLKYEGLNPTGSFKDRGMTMAVSKAKADGSDSVICASTGNTSASAAAYAARAGMKAFVLIPEGKIALGKLSQAMIHGAQVLQVLGNFDDALSLVKEVSAKYPVTLVNSLNPYRIEGQKSAAFEIVRRLGDAPDYHILPVGNAGTSRRTGPVQAVPCRREVETPSRDARLAGGGAAPIVRGAPVAKPETVAHRHPYREPRLVETGGRRARRVGGFIRMVSDAEILEAYKLVAETEGVFCEPASAASIAGVDKIGSEGFFRAGQRLVCTLTGMA